MENSTVLESQYHADLRLAIEKGISNMSHITLSDDGDGTFVVRFTHSLLQTPCDVELQISPQEWSGYPSEHFLVAKPTGTYPAAILPPLDDFPAHSFGVKIYESLASLSRSLGAALGAAYGAQDEKHDEVDGSMQDASGNEDIESDGNEEFEDFEVDDDEVDTLFGLESDDGYSETSGASFGKKLPQVTLNRIRRDSRAARAAGFKIGILGGFRHVKDDSIVSLAVRADKLCLSKETRQAWCLGHQDFVVLLIQYSGGYTTYEQAIDRAAALSKMQFRLRKCTQYKPSFTQARKAFASLPASKKEQDADDSSHLSLLSIGKSIDAFMDGDFVSMVKIREKEGVSWDNAKKLLTQMSLNMAGIGQEDKQLPSPHFGPQHSHPSDDRAKLPAFIAKDHLAASGEVSLPLVAARFAMRYLLRCVDYCMVCHEAVDDNFEALKPYVCGKSLCLFQYMSMGLGPSIDQEIMTQPNVVDLLISFCYSSLIEPGLREYPTGLSLQVPKIAMSSWFSREGSHTFSVMEGSGRASVVVGGVLLTDPIAIIVRGDPSTVQVEVPSDILSLREGHWVMVVVPHENGALSGPPTAHHGRIDDIIHNTVTLHLVSKHELPDADRDGWFATENATTTAESSKPQNQDIRGYMLPYDQNMDELEERQKQLLMMLLLETTPSVESMRNYLSSHPDQQIESWDGLTPSASKLLRWVVASNRSYIVQVDECPTKDGKLEPGLARRREKISGVDGWLQFRFAQGSPERELAFQHALQAVKKQPKSILAWHGSALGHWHSIIRAGLNFDRVVNGRVYGHGVYFSRRFDVSRGYCGHLPTRNWSNSALNVEATMSLNELVNLPEQYRAKNDFCYVVTDLRWIQCRYLFVRPKSLSGSSSAVSSSAERNEAEFVQDREYAATGVGDRRLFVPRLAIPSVQDDDRKPPLSDDLLSATGHSGDTGDEDSADRDFLWAEDDEDDDGNREVFPPKTGSSAETKPPRPEIIGDVSPGFVLETSKTEFRPGSLDLSTLPKLAPPSYATPLAQKTIRREIAKLQCVQSSTPIHELGWFIDFEQITNMFQWIVELHSFEPSLPLAADMKKAGVTSIVLELRFGRDFPLSPPFVRVIRPRFLPFLQGGGGNVTAGGAMCMELLTNSGWSPVSSLESVLLQVRLALSGTDPQPARLQVPQRQRDYGIGEALEAYRRAATTHQWQIPTDLAETATNMVEAPEPSP